MVGQPYPVMVGAEAGVLTSHVYPRHGNRYQHTEMNVAHQSSGFEFVFVSSEAEHKNRLRDFLNMIASWTWLR